MKMIAIIALGSLTAACDNAYAETDYYGSPVAKEIVTKVAGHGPLAAANGMTLYTFDKDTKNKSNCYDNCASNWPPYAAKAGAASMGKGFSVIKRRDGTSQWAKDGAPLYFWVGDSDPGDTTGDGVGGVWHLAK